MGPVKTFGRLALVGIVAFFLLRGFFGFYGSLLSVRPRVISSESLAREKVVGGLVALGGGGRDEVRHELPAKANAYNKAELYKEEQDIDEVINRLEARGNDPKSDEQKGGSPPGISKEMPIHDSLHVEHERVKDIGAGMATKEEEVAKDSREEEERIVGGIGVEKQHSYQEQDKGDHEDEEEDSKRTEKGQQENGPERMKYTAERVVEGTEKTKQHSNLELRKDDHKDEEANSKRTEKAQEEEGPEEKKHSTERVVEGTGKAKQHSNLEPRKEKKEYEEDSRQTEKAQQGRRPTKAGKYTANSAGRMVWGTEKVKQHSDQEQQKNARKGEERAKETQQERKQQEEGKHRADSAKVEEKLENYKLTKEQDSKMSGENETKPEKSFQGGQSRRLGSGTTHRSTNTGNILSRNTPLPRKHEAVGRYNAETNQAKLANTTLNSSKAIIIGSSNRSHPEVALTNQTAFAREGDVINLRLKNISVGAPPKPITADRMNYTIKVNLDGFKTFKDALRIMADAHKTVILSLVDAGFVEFALNFYAISIHRLNLTNYLPVCIDHKAWDTLRKRGIPCYLETKVLFSNVSSNSASDFGTPSFHHKTNLKTKLVLDALRFGYNVLMVDLDVILFKNPFPFFTCDDCDIHVQMDQTHWNTGFVLARATTQSIKLYQTAWEEYLKYGKSHDQSYVNMAKDIMRLNNNTLKAHELSQILFPCGAYYFESDNRMFSYGLNCKECVIAHNNFIGTTAAKTYRFKENLLWIVDTDNYYTDANRKYITYGNTLDFGHNSLEMERTALRNALAIGQVTNRTVILPSFRCCDCSKGRCEVLRHTCSLLDVAHLKKFDRVFRNMYREHTFLSNPQVPDTLNKSVSELLLIKSTLYDQQLLTTTDRPDRFFTPKNLTTGAEQQELEQWLAPYSNVSILRFHSLYNAFSSFTDQADNELFQRRIHAGGLTGCIGYAQFEKDALTWV